LLRNDLGFTALGVRVVVFLNGIICLLRARVVGFVPLGTMDMGLFLVFLSIYGRGLRVLFHCGREMWVLFHCRAQDVGFVPLRARPASPLRVSFYLKIADL
jgi:hypothetical protein